MALQISVGPAGDGWAVRSDLLDDELTFDQGARAEAAARSLANRASRRGLAAEVRIFLRDGAFAGAIEFPASDDGAADAASASAQANRAEVWGG